MACGSSGPLQLLTWVKLRYLRFGTYGCTKRTCLSQGLVHWLRRPSPRTALNLKHSLKRATVNDCMVCLRFITTNGAHNSRAEQGQLLPLPQLTGNRMRVYTVIYDHALAMPRGRLARRLQTNEPIRL